MAEEPFNKRIEMLEEAMGKIKDYPKELQQEALKFLLSETQIQKSPSEKSKKKKKISRRKSSGKLSGIGLQIEKMIEEQFFNKPKSMREISNKLSISGFNIKLPYLSPILIKFVRNGLLIRHKDEKGRYVYYLKEESNV